MNVHTCLRDALVAAGLDITKTIINEPVLFEDLAQICVDLDVEPFSEGGFWATVGEPIIVIYKTRPGWAHAEFTTDAREMTKGRQVVAVIRINSKIEP